MSFEDTSCFLIVSDSGLMVLILWMAQMDIISHVLPR